VGKPRPLSGVRVADFTWVWAGPHCTQQLAHLGAEVIRVESSTRPCVTRMLPPFADFKPGPNRSGYFNQYNQGKRSLTLDLKHPDGLDVARRLCAASDVVVENFAAGVMERIGLGYDVLRAARPDLVMISLSGYGATGPDHDKVSYGPAQVPLSGMSSLTGYRDHPPMHVGVSYGDPTAGLHGAVAVLAALLHRSRTGSGQHIDLSQWETSIVVLADALMAQQMNGQAPARDGNRHPHMAPHGIFPAAGDDRWIAIAVEDDPAWRRLAVQMGRPELADDPRFATFTARQLNEEALDEMIGAWTAEMDPDELTETLQRAHVAAHTVATNRDLAQSEHLEATGAFVRHPHPEVGSRQHLGPPWRLNRHTSGAAQAAPCLGADTDDVLRDVCGYDDADIERLRSAGALS
jgi:crotonobetainyl-CoA:carnitine CoA-transferase CaiB-like acyl-CoA transferase